MTYLADLIEAESYRITTTKEDLDRLTELSKQADDKLVAVYAQRRAAQEIGFIEAIKAINTHSQEKANKLEIMALVLVPVVLVSVLFTHVARNPDICIAPPPKGTVDNPIKDTNWKLTEKCWDNRAHWEKIIKPIYGIER